MSDQTADRAAILREMRKKKAVLTLPDMDAVTVRTGTYNTGHEQLAMDIYYPPSAPGPVPVVVIAFSFPDPPGQIREYGPMTSWARLIAASGMAAVLYATNECAENIHALAKHLRTNADELRLEASRIGIWAISANVTVALSALMRDDTFKCAALICGYTMDLDGSTVIAGMAKQYLFTDACAGKSVDDLPAGVPLLFVRAGKEHFPGVNEALDLVVARSIARNLPVTLVNHATGGHNFAFDEDNELSRGIIRQVLAFLAFHLGG